ncbi:MAG TPA: phosphatase PAP2 family protein [Metabacillus sp.]|nr:phosphatase PAP2 family protein [Metabacillus sp.]
MKIKYISSLLALAFIVLILLIKWNVVKDVDTKIGDNIYQIHDHVVSTIISGIGTLGSTIGIISILFLFMFIFAWLEKGFISAGVLFITVLLGNIGNKVLKALVARERPAFPQYIEDGYSFPSGHVMVGVLLFGMIAYNLMKRTSQKSIKQTIFYVTSVLILLIGFSRLLEGEHFLTDVIGGILVGSIMLMGMIKLDKYVHQILKNRKVKKDVAL